VLVELLPVRTVAVASMLQLEQRTEMVVDRLVLALLFL
jgi:hypothetical protein